MIASILGGLLSTLALAGAALSPSPAAHRASAPQQFGVSTPVAVAVAQAASGSAAPGVPDDKLLGQRIMVGFPGAVAPSSLLRAVRQGHVGSVILFASNIGTRAELRALTGSLQRAARQGGNPPLLVSVDQEGGQVKRLTNGPPDLSPPQIARTGKTSVSTSEGRATGRYLKGLGINWNLAPVADVPTFSRAFIWTQGRAFSFDPLTVSRFASAFALGLQSAGVAATAKHFPGLGTAPIDTDNKLAELHPTRRQRIQALEPYKAMIPQGLDSIMITVAGFPAYDRSGAPAALSSPIIRGLLRGRLRFQGVTITDALGTPTGHDEITAGVLAARAGADVLLYTDSAPGELRALEAALRRGQITRGAAGASYRRILALKRKVAGG